MLKHLTKILTGITVVLETSKAKAVDPYQIAGVAAGMAASYASGGTAGMALGAAGSLLGGGGKGDVEDFSSIGFAFTDLLDDFEIAPDAGESLRRKTRELEEAQMKLREGSDQVSDLGSSIDDVKSSSTLRSSMEAVHTMVQRTKSIARLIPGHPKATQSALQVQQARLDYMMLDELTALHRMELEKQIDSNMRASRYQLIANDIRAEEKKQKVR